MTPFRILLAAVSAAALAPVAASALPSECDEACLVRTANDFLGAVGASDASLLDWNAYARWTLNGVELPFSEAVWGLVNEMSDAHRIVVPDVETGTVGVITTWTFDTTPSLMAARLKVDFGRLSEAETIVVTQPANPPAPPGSPQPPAIDWPQFAQLGAADPAFAAPVARPAPRAALIAAADAYIDGIVSGAAPLAADCARIDNGKAAESCAGTGIYRPVTEAAPRRYAAVDPARGLVFAVLRLNDDGAASRRAPGSVLLAAALKIEDGQVTRVETVGEDIFYYIPTGWD